MISGWFDAEGQLRFEIELIDELGVPLAVDALLDTGSTEWLVLSNQDIEILGWSKIGRKNLKTVQGEITVDVYAGKVIFDGLESDIPVVASATLEDYLIGIPWLLFRRLVVDRQGDVLTLGEEETPRN
jgi:predicted aspartyl protease